jgi:hypothetical protein
MSFRRTLAAAALVLAAGCHQAVHKDAMAMGPVILPNSMCALHGTVAMSKDKEGERMVCELQEQIGTHIPRCVCWDEGYTERERELALEMLRGVNSLNACGGFGDSNHAAASCQLGNVGTSSALGTR